MFARIMRAFRPLDTSQVDAAIADAARAHQDVRVRARALRMDVSCSDACAAVERIGDRLGRAVPLLQAYSADRRIPTDMKDLLGRI